jgi:hypothetical protein
VIQDCLQICCNVLEGSETCQRLFYGMGGNWHLQLIQFFTPSLLESFSQPPFHGNGFHASDGDHPINSSTQGIWYEQSGRLRCAVIALETFAHSLTILSSPNYHKIFLPIAENTLFPSLLHWIIRNGPTELLLLSLQTLELFLAQTMSEKRFGLILFQLLLRFTPSVPGLHVPLSLSSTHNSLLPSLSLLYSFRSSISNDHRVISVMNLLIERYLHGGNSWYGHDSFSRERDIERQKEREKSGLTQDIMHLYPQSLYLSGSDYSLGSLRIFQKLLSLDEMTSGMVIQHILAPPPPDGMDDFDDEDAQRGREKDKGMDFGSIILSVLLNSLEKISLYVSSPTGVPNSSTVQQEVSLIVRTSNLLSLIILHGGLLASELCTALSTHHLIRQRSLLDNSFHSHTLQQQSNHPVLPYMLSLSSRMIRIPGGSGWIILSSILKILSVACTGCERATLQVVSDFQKNITLDRFLKTLPISSFLILRLLHLRVLEYHLLFKFFHAFFLGFALILSLVRRTKKW